MIDLSLFNGLPFTAAMARDAGITRNRLHKMVASGLLRVVLHGVYVGAAVRDSLDLRARAAALVLPPHVVVADRGASWLHGIDILDLAELDAIPALDAVSTGGKGRSRRSGVRGGKRDLSTAEVWVLPSGVRVTSPVRTACDVACLFGRYRAIAALDEFRRKHGLSVADLYAALPRFRGRRGVIQLRELIPLTVDCADSQPESWTRLMIHDHGLPMPHAQVDLIVPGWGAARVENAYPHLRIAIEYDGEENHTSDEDREHDLTRRAALAAAGWLVIVLRKSDFTPARRAVWLADLASAIAERTPVQPSRRHYSRGPDHPSYPRRRARA
ncbi:type IV toxin-antitoxin system AbiEi family antitoxin domain-containing protein [Nocardioides sp. Root190]|uniref:type IV toxin-antitoxin system AbiEi family antitoxin domain-containing protein n=1 Tax=Nocardioides sp. Root190 TaxID=1736488 RepID=UPI000A66B0F9|nr:type IV toxin-antitoxin system AbiEi family antitoxin domain-containing protein [Nocardioides sp. Root190]